MQTAAFTVNEIDARGAAEVIGLDCAQPLDSSTVAALMQAFRDHPVLVVRDQHLEPRAQTAFTHYFGPLEVHTVATYNHPDDPGVQIISNELRADGSAIGVVDAGDFWHSDSSFKAEPCKCTLLHAIRNPQRGGNTAFCNLTHVYAALAPELKARLDGRFAYHHLSKFKNPRVSVSAVRPDATEHYARADALPEILQPVVRTHSETGRRSLYVSPRFTLRIDGMAEAESEALLLQLFDFMQQEQFIYTHKWRDHDMVIWDNRCLNHLAAGGYALPDIRRMHRTAVRDEPAYYIA